MPLPPHAAALFLPPLAAWGEQAEHWWRDARMWTLMYRGSLLAGGLTLGAFVLWQIVAARRERARLETLVAGRTRQLRQSEELFRSFFEHAIEGVFQSSLDGHNLRANPAMALLCGYRDPEEMRALLTDAATQFYVRPERRAEIDRIITRDGVATGVESEVRRKDGSTIWVAENVRTVTDPSTGNSVYQGSIVDVTARRAMEHAREQARAAAEDASRAKSAFLAQITHELRTPLTGILGRARVALLDAELGPKNHERFTQIAASGEHLLGLIDELLDLSRIEAGRFELRPAAFSLDGLLRALGEEFGQRAGDARLDFALTADPALPRMASGDAGRLRQVLVNLLGNAIKFTERGEIALRVARGEGGGVRFEVADSGIGIPAEDIGRVFEPFYQGAGRPGGTGVGLGLNISSRLVEAMGGRLQVASEVGGGSRFWFEIPLPNADDGATLDGAPDTRMGNVVHEIPTPPEPGPLPDEDEIKRLLSLALAGDIVRLREQLNVLRNTAPACAGFLRETERLAAGFQMDAITRLLRDARRQTGERATPSPDPVP